MDSKLLYIRKLWPNFEEYFWNQRSGGWRINNKVFIDYKMAEAAAEKILNYMFSYENDIGHIFCQRIISPYANDKKKLIEGIIHIMKIHEIKGHERHMSGSIYDESIAMLIELANANGMYFFFRIWINAYGPNSDFLHREAARLVLEKFSRYENSGKKYIGKVLANADVEELKKVAIDILEKEIE